VIPLLLLIVYFIQIWERLRGGLDEIGRLNTSCPLGLHADGMCSCESFPMAEESSTRSSISRIVMLAEALFEVLTFPQLSYVLFAPRFNSIQCSALTPHFSCII
jgi:hypothetical protein